MAAAWTGVGVGVALLGDGLEEIGREAERSKVKRGSCVGSRRGRGARERDGGAGRSAHGRRSGVGRPEHSRNRGRPVRARRGVRVHGVGRRARRMVRGAPANDRAAPVRGLMGPLAGDGLPAAAILAGPRPTTRQTGTTEDAAPHGRILSPRRVPTRRPRTAHPARVASRLARAHRRRPMAAPASRASFCRRRHNPPSSRPHAVFRQRGGKRLAGPDRRRPAGVHPPVHPSDRRSPSSPRSSSASGSVASPAPGTSGRASRSSIVVGPVGSQHRELHRPAPRTTRAQARSYGAYVIEIYSPYATWSRVKAAAQGANLLIYLGHGNGYPSPYGAFQRVHQGRARA